MFEIAKSSLWNYRGVTNRGAPAMSANVSSADWIRERLTSPESCVVTSIVPSGFEAYARILHPAQVPRDGVGLVRWSDVSRWSGVSMHSRIQWHDVALPQTAPLTEAPWRGQGPRQGGLFLPDAEALIEDLTPHTRTAETCYFCLWIGYFGGGTPFVRLGDPPVKGPEPAQPPRLVELPWREYGLFEGLLAQGASIEMENGLGPQTSNLWWPADHSWCVASEIDLPWTYVGGSCPLIERVLADERIEGFEVAPNDPSCTKVEGWLLDLIERATDEVIETGAVNLTLALGTVEVNWQPSGRRGRGLITTRSTRKYGESASTSPVKTRDRAGLRSQVHFRVRGAVLALVEA